MVEAIAPLDDAASSINNTKTVHKSLLNEMRIK